MISPIFLIHLPTYFIENGITSVMIGNEKTDLKIFGNHNLLNLQAAHYVCKNLGVNDRDFADAILNFTGASKRLELLSESSPVMFIVILPMHQVK